MIKSPQLRLKKAGRRCFSHCRPAKTDEPVGNRTQNPRLKRPLLCQLSYGPNDPEYSTTGKKWANWKLETGYWKLEDRDSAYLPPLLIAGF